MHFASMFRSTVVSGCLEGDHDPGGVVGSGSEASHFRVVPAQRHLSAGPTAGTAGAARTAITPIAVALLVSACGSIGPSNVPSSTPPHSAPAGQTPPASMQSEPSGMPSPPAVEPASLTLQIDNRDASAYQIAWGEDLSRRSWAIKPQAIGRVEVGRGGAGTLLLTRECNYIGTWEIGPGSYRISISDGAATLVESLSLVPARSLQEVEPCPHQGP